MRLLTHNLLMCNRKQCKGGFPLAIKLSQCAKDSAMADAPAAAEASSTSTPAEAATSAPSKPYSVETSEFSSAFVKNMLAKLEWDALVKTANDVAEQLPEEERGCLALPPTFASSDADDETFLQAVHNAILDFHVLSGSLKCPSCGREYGVDNGIPNMLLHDDEV
eukprot:GDKH01014938.1.p1 GENE.GDKH01014938.1~~GDKH01014938.1.p1  ORF type:complete len:165 (-),score=29.45 GDKH01014938.1:135-629(-)